MVEVKINSILTEFRTIAKYKNQKVLRTISSGTIIIVCSVNFYLLIKTKKAEKKSKIVNFILTKKQKTNFSIEKNWKGNQYFSVKMFAPKYKDRSQM